MFYLFGQFGLCLEKAYNEKISIKEENAHIKHYEKDLTALVAFLPHEGETTEGQGIFEDKCKTLFAAYKLRQEDVVTLNGPAWQGMQRAVLADLKAKIEKYNQKNTSKQIDTDSCLKRIEEQFNTLEAKNESADAYTLWYMKFITPKEIAKNGLQCVAEFAEHYIKLFKTATLSGSTTPTPETLKNVAALCIRSEIVKNPTSGFPDAVKALNQTKSSANKINLVVLLNYFTHDLKSEAEQTEFLKAVFEKPLANTPAKK